MSLQCGSRFNKWKAACIKSFLCSKSSNYKQFRRGFMKIKGILLSFFRDSESITTVSASIFLFLLFPRWQCRQISLFPAVMGPLLLVIDWQSFQFLFAIFHKMYHFWRFNDLIKYRYPRKLCFENTKKC